MVPLLEDQTKAWLGRRGLPVPKGASATSAELAGQIAGEMLGGCFVKALVPAGRRGKAGAVRSADDATAAFRAAADILGTTLAGYKVSQVYVEERIEVDKELYLSISLSSDHIKMLVSQQGGVDIEETFARTPGKVVSDHVDILSGLSRWQAIDLWHKAGLRGPVLRALGDLSIEIYRAFREADAHVLEVNPVAVDRNGQLSVVGAMMAVDEYALFRHPKWRDVERSLPALQHASEREQRVRSANAALPGGEAQYIELEGDIGLLVGGGGAGLYVHDLIESMGGRPANHCVTPPTSGDTRKLKEVLRAILDNPRLRGLLVAFNFAQMARADLRIEALAEVLQERELKDSCLPIVVRLFGPGEDKARKIAAEFPNMSYLPRGASLRDACKVIIEKIGGVA